MRTTYTCLHGCDGLYHLGHVKCWGAVLGHGRGHHVLVQLCEREIGAFAGGRVGSGLRVRGREIGDGRGALNKKAVWTLKRCLDSEKVFASLFLPFNGRYLKFLSN